MTEHYSGHRGPEEESNPAEEDSHLSEEERLRKLTGEDSREWLDEFSNLMESLGSHGAPEQDQKPVEYHDENPSGENRNE